MRSPRVVFIMTVCAVALMLIGCGRPAQQSSPPVGGPSDAEQIEAEAPPEAPADEDTTAESAPGAPMNDESVQETEPVPKEPVDDEEMVQTEPSDAESESTEPSNTTEEDPSMPIEVSSQSFDEKVLNADVPVLVDFWAPWCGPCLMMHPVLEELAEDYEGRVVIARLNIDEGNNQDLARRYEVRAIPFMAIFKDGEIYQQLIGVRPEDELRDALDEAIEE